MGAKRKPTAKMQDMYARKREKTLASIEAAIKEMKDDGELVTKKLIMERAGVSSGTLSKPYVIELLKKEKVCQFQGLLAPMNKEERDTLKELSTMAKDNSRLKNKIEALTITISTLQDQKAKMSADLKAVKEENELLRGQRQLLLERLNNAGISLGNIKL